MKLPGLQVAHSVQDDVIVRRKQPVRAHCLPQATCLKVLVFKNDGMLVWDGLARNPTKNEVITVHARQHKGRSALGLVSIS